MLENYLNHLKYKNILFLKIIIMHSNIISSTKIVIPYNTPNINLNKLRIITFNIAGQAQNNNSKIYSSERQFVKLCQKTYQGGWSNDHDSDTTNNNLSNANNTNNNLILSQCTLNAAQWLAHQRADIIGLQEVVNKYMPLIIQQFKGYDYIGHNNSYIIYNKNLGLAQIISPKFLTINGNGRTMLVVWFPDVKLVVVNLHAAHNIDLKISIEQVFNANITKNIKPTRIIVTGDFNDAYGCNLQQLNLLGFKLQQHGIPTKSCCTDRKYIYYGDYIFDSEYQIPGFYGTPCDGIAPILYDDNNNLYLNPNSKNKLMSDHNPVVFYPRK